MATPGGFAMGGSAGSAWITIGANVLPFVSGIEKAQRSLVGFQKTALKIMAVYIAVKKVTSEFVAFDRELKNTWTLLDATSAQMDKTGKAVRAMARDYQVSATEAMQALYHINSATFYGAEAMEILEESTRGAAAGLATLGATGDMLTTVLNAYKMSASEAATVNDQLFTAIRYGKTTMGELASQVGRLAGVSAPVGASFSDMAAAIATLTRQGIRTDWAITSLRQTLMQFIKPVKNLKTALADLGYASGSALIKQVGFAEALKMVTKWAKENGVEMEQMFTNVRAITAVLPLATTAADRYALDISRMANSAGAASEAFGKQTKSMSYQIQRFSSLMSDMAISIGGTLAPALSFTMTILSGLAKVLSITFEILSKFGGSYVLSIAVGFLTISSAAKGLTKAVAELNTQQAWLGLGKISSSMTLGLEKLTESFRRFFGKLAVNNPIMKKFTKNLSYLGYGVKNAKGQFTNIRSSTPMITGLVGAAVGLGAGAFAVKQIIDIEPEFRIEGGKATAIATRQVLYDSIASVIGSGISGAALLGSTIGAGPGAVVGVGVATIGVLIKVAHEVQVKQAELDAPRAEEIKGKFFAQFDFPDTIPGLMFVEDFLKTLDNVPESAFKVIEESLNDIYDFSLWGAVIGEAGKMSDEMLLLKRVMGDLSSTLALSASDILSTAEDAYRASKIREVTGGYTPTEGELLSMTDADMKKWGQDLRNIMNDTIDSSDLEAWMTDMLQTSIDNSIATLESKDGINTEEISAAIADALALPQGSYAEITSRKTALSEAIGALLGDSIDSDEIFAFVQQNFSGLQDGLMMTLLDAFGTGVDEFEAWKVSAATTASVRQKMIEGLQPFYDSLSAIDPNLAKINKEFFDLWNTLEDTPVGEQGAVWDNLSGVLARWRKEIKASADVGTITADKADELTGHLDNLGRVIGILPDGVLSLTERFNELKAVLDNPDATWSEKADALRGLIDMYSSVTGDADLLAKYLDMTDDELISVTAELKELLGVLEDIKTLAQQISEVKLTNISGGVGDAFNLAIGDLVSMLAGGVENADIGSLVGIVGSISGGSSAIESAMEAMERVYNSESAEISAATKARAREIHAALSTFLGVLGLTDQELADAAKAAADERERLVGFMADYPEQIAELQRQLAEGERTGNYAMKNAALQGLEGMANSFASNIEGASGALVALNPYMQRYLNYLVAEYGFKIDASKSSQTIIDQYKELKKQYEEAAVGSAARAEALQGLLSLYPRSIELQDLMASHGEDVNSEFEAMIAYLLGLGPALSGAVDDFGVQITALEEELAEARLTGNTAMELSALEGLNNIAQSLYSTIENAEGPFAALIPVMQQYVDQLVREHGFKVGASASSQTIIDQYEKLKKQYDEAAVGSAARAEALQGLLNLYPRSIELQELMADHGETVNEEFKAMIAYLLGLGPALEEALTAFQLFVSEIKYATAQEASKAVMDLIEKARTGELNLQDLILGSQTPDSIQSDLEAAKVGAYRLLDEREANKVVAVLQNALDEIAAALGKTPDEIKKEAEAASKEAAEKRTKAIEDFWVAMFAPLDDAEIPEMSEIFKGLVGKIPEMDAAFWDDSEKAIKEINSKISEVYSGIEEVMSRGDEATMAEFGLTVEQTRLALDMLKYDLGDLDINPMFTKALNDIDAGLPAASVFKALKDAFIEYPEYMKEIADYGRGLVDLYREEAAALKTLAGATEDDIAKANDLEQKATELELAFGDVVAAVNKFQLKLDGFDFNDLSGSLSSLSSDMISELSSLGPDTTWQEASEIIGFVASTSSAVEALGIEYQQLANGILGDTNPQFRQWADEIGGFLNLFGDTDEKIAADREAAAKKAQSDAEAAAKDAAAAAQDAFKDMFKQPILEGIRSGDWMAAAKAISGFAQSSDELMNLASNLSSANDVVIDEIEVLGLIVGASGELMSTIDSMITMGNIAGDNVDSLEYLKWAIEGIIDPLKKFKRELLGDIIFNPNIFGDKYGSDIASLVPNFSRDTLSGERGAGTRVPALAVGGDITSDGFALLHAGESVIPAGVSSLSTPLSAGSGCSGGVCPIPDDLFDDSSAMIAQAADEVVASFNDVVKVADLSTSADEDSIYMLEQFSDKVGNAFDSFSVVEGWANDMESVGLFEQANYLKDALEIAKNGFIESVSGMSIEMFNLKNALSKLVSTINSTVKSAVKDLFRSLFSLSSATDDAASSLNVPSGYKVERAAWAAATPGELPDEMAGSEDEFSFEDWAIQLGLDILTAITDAFVDFTWDNYIQPWSEDFWNNFIMPVVWEKWIKQFLWGDVIKPFIWEPIIAPAITWITNFVGALTSGTATLAGFGLAIAGVMIVLAALGALIGVVIGVLAFLWGAIQGIGDLLTAFFAPIIEAVAWAWEAMTPLIDGARKLFGSLAPIMEMFGEVVAFGIRLVAPLFTILGVTLGWFGDIIRVVADAIKWLWDNSLGFVLKLFANMMAGVANIVIEFGNAVSGVIKFITFGIVDLGKTNPVEIPALASGGFVTSTGAALIHKGEVVAPAGTASLDNYGGNGGGVIENTIMLDGEVLYKGMKKVNRNEQLRRTGSSVGGRAWQGG